MEASEDVLRQRADDIIERWTRDVRRNIDSKHATDMTYEAIRSRLPLILDAIAARFSVNSSDPAASLPNTALGEQLTIPVRLGFDVAEMLREFGIFRTLVLSAIEANFEADDITNAILALHRIDHVLNGITTQATQDFADYQLQRVEPMHRELLASNQELIRLVQAQKDNASHLAHELKNPIHAIISFSTILLRKKQKALEADPSQASEIKQIEKICDNGQQMSALITNMLEVSLREHQQLSLNIELVDVIKLIDRVVESMESEAREKNISLIGERSLTPPQVNTDSLRLQQIIANLVSNAIRYTDEGSVVVRCYSIDDSHWAVSVRDTGRGLSTAQQEEIFSPYVRVGAASNYAPRSTGLGLTIVSKLVDLLKGEIELVSEPGEGSTFTVTLPLDIE